MAHRTTLSRRHFFAHGARFAGTTGLFALSWMPFLRSVRAADEAAQILDIKAAGHGLPRAVKFSPDGKWIAAVTDSSLVLYDAQTLREVWSIKKGKGEEIAFAPNSAVVVVVLDDMSVLAYDVTDGSQRALLLNPGETIYSNARIVFSPDGSLLASGTDNGTIRIWRVTDWSEQYTLYGHETGIANLIFSADSSMLVSTDSTYIPTDYGQPLIGTIRTWQLSDGSLLHSVALPRYSDPVGLAAEGKALILSNSRRLEMYRVSDTNLSYMETLGSDAQDYNVRVGGVFSYDEALIAINAGNRLAVHGVYDSLARNVFSLQSASEYAMSIAISPDNHTLAVVSSNGTIRLGPITF